MSIETLGPGALDYLPCRYGPSKLLFRGPRRSLDKPYVAFIGGTETYGKFVRDPYPALVEREIDVPCVNFGLLNAGIDAFVRDPFVIDAASQAAVAVVQVVGAQNLSNRFYSVHPRRNDRLVDTSTLLRTIFKEVDFSEFHFTRHMLTHLQMISAERFEVVRHEVQQAWVARMRLMLGQITGKTVLLWLSPGGGPSEKQDTPSLGADPLFVTRDMITRISTEVTDVVEVDIDPQTVGADTEGMVFSEMESMAAKEMLGPIAHQTACAGLVPVLEALR